MTPFEFNGAGRLVHLNARREGPEDARVLACDLKLAVVTSNDILVSFHPQLRLMLFQKDGEPRFLKMGAVPWDHAFKGMVLRLARLVATPVQFVGVTVKDFDFLARKNGKVEMHFKAQVKPDHGQFESLGKILLEEDLTLAIHSADGQLFGADEDIVARAAGEAAQGGMHDIAKKDGTSVTIMATDDAGNVTSAVTLGALTTEIEQQMRGFGKVEAEKHEEDRDFDVGFHLACGALNLGKAFVDEYFSELQSAYTEGWEGAPADA
jgi:hypothetical protein